MQIMAINNEQVTLYLNTPLVSIKPRQAGEVDILIIKAKVLEETASGLLIQMKAAGNEKAMLDNLPFKKILVPTHKIDFIVVE